MKTAAWVGKQALRMVILLAAVTGGGIFSAVRLPH